MDGLTLDIINIIILLGGIQGILLYLIFLSGRKKERRSNFFMSILILSVSLVNIVKGMHGLGLSKSIPVISYLPFHWTLLMPFAIFYFVRYLTNPNYKLTRKEYLWLIPFAIQLTLRGYMFILFFVNREYLDQQENTLFVYLQVLEGMAIFFCGAAIVASIRMLNSFQIGIYQQYSNLETKSLLWLRNTLAGVLIIWIFWAVPFVFSIYSNQELDQFLYPVWVGTSFAVYWMAYFLHLRVDLFDIVEVNSSSNPSASELSEKSTEHFDKVLSLMEKDKIYRNPELNMNVLANKTGLSNGYLSLILNKKKGKNFFEFVNEYRVNEVISRMSDDKYSHLSLLGLALDSGFKSKSTFNSVFKKFTGQTPSAFRKSQS